MESYCREAIKPLEAEGVFGLSSTALNSWLPRKDLQTILSRDNRRLANQQQFHDNTTVEFYHPQEH
jgi:hypothetical protein